jgi:hypothetical protein
MQLVTNGRILPVLDGLDELPERLRATAIAELTGGLVGGSWSGSCCPKRPRHRWTPRFEEGSEP